MNKQQSIAAQCESLSLRLIACVCDFNRFVNHYGGVNEIVPVGSATEEVQC